MIVGSVKERKDHEYRVGLIPAHAHAFIQNGHQVIVESNLGVDSGYTDEDYRQVGATAVKNKEEVWQKAQMIIKVKEPLPSEYDLMQEGQILFTYLHLASNVELAHVLKKKKVSAIAYETVQDNHGRLPLLMPMSEVAGRLAVQEGSKYLQRQFGGQGILLSGVCGTKKGRVLIIGSGTVGLNACKTALGLGAHVSVMSIDLPRLACFDEIFSGRVETLYSDPLSLEHQLKEADLVIGSVLIPGDKAPKLITRKHLSLMKKGSVIVDVSIDQGGCCETSRPTTHESPTYLVDGVVHYCVANMPGAVAQTSTQALANATFPYGLKLANFGLDKACMHDEGLYKGLNVHRGEIVHEAVARALDMKCISYEKLRLLDEN